MLSDSPVEKETKQITHFVFRVQTTSGALDLAWPVADTSMQAAYGNPKTISVYNAALDKTENTNKIRAVTAIEAVKFVNGVFDPFKEFVRRQD